MASKIKNTQELNLRWHGYKAGTTLAKDTIDAQDTAGYRQMFRLVHLNLNGWLVGGWGMDEEPVAYQPPGPYAWASYVAFAASTTEDEEFTQEKAQAFPQEKTQQFWQRVLGDDRDARLECEEFLLGFVDGVDHVYHYLEDYSLTGRWRHSTPRVQIKEETTTPA